MDLKKIPQQKVTKIDKYGASWKYLTKLVITKWGISNRVGVKKYYNINKLFFGWDSYYFVLNQDLDWR